MIVPLRVSRPVSLEAVAKALESDERLCFIVAQRDPSDDDPTPQQFYRTGTVGIIMRMRKLSDGGLKILVQGLCRARIQRFVSDIPCYRVRIERTEDKLLGRSVNVEALVRSVNQNVEQAVRAGQDDPARAVDGRAERRRAGPHGGPGRVQPDAQAGRRAGAAGAGRAGAAPHQGQPGAGEGDRHPGGAESHPEPRQGGDVQDPARLLPARAAAADPARARRRRRPSATRSRRCAPRSSARGCRPRRASRRTSRCGGWNR